MHYMYVRPANVVQPMWSDDGKLWLHGAYNQNRR